MARNTFVGGGDGIEIIDLNNRFNALVKHGAKAIRKRLEVPILLTANALAKRIEAGAAEGPDAPHINNTVTFKQRGLSAQVGYLAEDFGGDPAGPHPNWSGNGITTVAWVALFNEYSPNRQPFMLPAAEAESKHYVARMMAAVQSAERALSRGVL